jgi:hypothetical protein
MINTLLFILMVGGPVGLAWVGTLLFRRHKKAPTDDKLNEVAGFIFAPVSVVYAVLLAFVVIIVWEQYLAAESAVSQEAAALITVARENEFVTAKMRRVIGKIFKIADLK